MPFPQFVFCANQNLLLNKNEVNLIYIENCILKIGLIYIKGVLEKDILIQ